MADNVAVVAGAFTDTVASDQVGGAQYQRIKVALGAADAVDMDLDSGQQTMVNSMPVVIASDQSAVPVADGGGSLTVDVGTALPAGNNNIGDVDIASVPAPLNVVGGGTEAAALRVTMANNSSGVVGVTDNGDSLTVDGTVTANLAAGTNNIGDVDVLSVVPGTAATNLGKAEDAAHTTGDVGVMVLGVRNDAGTALAADGDYIPLSINSAGEVRVTGGGGGTQYTEADTDASITGNAILWEDTSDTLRAVSAAKPLPVSVIAALPAGTANIGDVDIASIAAGDNNIGNVDIVTLPALVAGTANIGDVDVLTLPALVAGSANIGDVDVLTLPAKKLTYAASSNLDVTSLNGLAASATHVLGWESPIIDNSTNRYMRYRITAKITVESAGLAAGEIRMGWVDMLDDSTWPDVFDGTQSAETVTDTLVRDAIVRPLAVTATDTTASQVYYLVGYIDDAPEKFLIFITQSTTTTLETSGNQVTVKGIYLT